MDITISVSEKAVENIRVKAEENGKAVDDFIEEFVEENFANGKGEKPERKHNLLAFAGMFNSGKTDTSERMHELLDEADLDPAEGFSIR